MDPYDDRTYQYKNHYVKGFGVYEDRVDDWFEGRGDGSEGEPTQGTLYECVYAERAARLRTPKAYPKPGNTFPAEERAPPDSSRMTPVCVGWEERDPVMRYALESGVRHIYTDGSGMLINEGETAEERFGAGMYDEYMVDDDCKEEVDSSFRWETGCQTVANGELFAIREALRLPPKPGETAMRIFTDSLVTLHLLRKARFSPWRLVGHDNEITLRVMLDNIRDRKNDMGDKIPVSFHKVKSHVGVRGNERADTLAKRACKEPGEAKVVEGSQGGPRKAWVTFGEGAGVTGYKRVSEGVRKHRQGGMISTEKVSKWHVVSGGLKLDMATAGKAAWGSHVPQGVRKTVHKARFGRLATQQNLHRWFPAAHPSPFCRLPGCTGGEEECATHMALNCSNAGMKGRSINRHNKVVEMFANTLKRGKKGGAAYHLRRR